MKNKRGITMTSIIIYVILFFVFTITVTVISSNFNLKLFTDRGLSININSFNKLQYNLLMSGKESSLVAIIGDELVFSNNDSYTYDSEKGVIRKNDGTLVSNVKSYSVNITEGDNGELLEVKIMFKKYLHEDEENRIVKVFVEGT